MNPQVLVVGAGPVGLTMAAELSRFGIAVRIVDSASHRTDKSKALVLWSRTLELLDRSGCSSAFVAAGHKVDAANIIAGGRLIAHVGLSSIESPFAYALMLPQSETERLLEAHLAGLDVVVERGVQLSGFTDTPSAVTATLQHADGTHERIEADWLVGCDGAHSTVRHTLGLPFIGDTLQSNWILADVHIAELSSPSNVLTTYWHEDGVLAVFPIAPGRYRIIADIGDDPNMLQGDPTLEQVQAVVDGRGPGGLTLSDPIWLSAFRINERKVSHYRKGRVFVAGDAAHVHSPAGGQGMNTGMQDAFNLAWKLALVCRQTCAPEKLLESYSVERGAVGDQVLAAAGRLTALAVMRNHTAQTVRNLLGGLIFGLAPVQRAIAGTLSEITIGYAHGPLTGPGVLTLAGPSPGERMPPSSQQPPVGSGSLPLFALAAAPSEEASRLLLDYPDLLEPSLRPPCSEGGMWLVRPDGYVAVVAVDTDVEPIAAFLVALTPFVFIPPASTP